jgi:MscS family membrane protein
MDLILNALHKINYSSIPLVKIAIAITILAVIQILKRVMVALVIKNLKRFAAKIELGVSDEIISILRSSLSFLFLIGGLWAAKEILADDIGVRINDLLTATLNIIAIFTISYALYQASSILGKIFANQVLQTGTDLDELLQPLMPKIFQSIAIVLIIIKLSELFLGRSATALIGLLGGAGITLGLVFKDILYDWFCTIIIYLDRVFKEGDWVKVAGTNGSSRVVKIGFRTTTLHLLNSGSIVKMPNSKMISGIVENWSQNYNKEVRLGIDITVKLDSTSAEQAKIICDRIQEVPKTLPGFYALCRVRFSQIELNLRTIEVLAFVKEEKMYFKAERQLNLAILKILEDAGVNPFYAPLPVVEEEAGG